MTSDRLSQQVWDFNLSINYSTKCIYFDRYSAQSRTPPQRKFRIDGSWDRLDHRDSSIKVPPLPHDILEEARQYFKQQIDTLEVKQ